jgi:hypothetical protein
MANNHKDHPEIWLRPSPILPLDVLSALIESRVITATPRLGARNGTHPKGYTEGQVALLRVLNDAGTEQLSRSIRIKSVTIRPLRQLRPDDLQNTFPYQNWKEVQRDLSHFEKRAVGDNEETSVIEFSYL